MSNLTGLIVKAISGFYYVEAADVLYECKARNFRKSGISPAVGDRVDISTADDKTGTVEKIYERKSFLTRPPVANLDRLFIVSSVSEPTPVPLIIDKLTAIAVGLSIEPIIVFTKSDLGDIDELASVYKSAGFKTIIHTREDDRGNSELLSLIPGKISAFIGNTGVGKSTLLNSLFPELSLKTGEISRKLGRGRHTTRHSELYKYAGGYIADTPGFSTIDLVRYGLDKKENAELCFPEFSDYITDCRFTGCAHLCEKGCAVLQAVNDGKIAQSRHNSYVAVYNEIKENTERR